MRVKEEGWLRRLILESYASDPRRPIQERLRAAVEAQRTSKVQYAQ